MKGIIYIMILLLVVYGCSPKLVVEDKTKIVEAPSEIFNLDSSQFSLVGDIQPFNSEITVDTIGDNQLLLKLTLYTDFPSALPSFAFKIKYPRRYISSLWSSRTWSSNSYINIPNYSRLQSDMSIVSGISSDDNNVITISADDNFNSRYTGVDVLRESDSLVFTLNFFKTSVPDAEILEFNVFVLIDLRKEQYSKTIRELAKWRLDRLGERGITKIDQSLLPVYSLWYPMERNIPIENITHYFDSISSMGFRSILFDDGWQNVVRFDVKSNGEWDPSETSVVKQFMDKAHEKNMKVVLWYSKPFVGAHKHIYNRFEGKYMQYITSSQSVLDIRYPDVRSYLSGIYSEVVQNWGVDGIWFDFLNGYYPDEHIVITEDKGRDFVSVRKSLDSLRVKMRQDIEAVNPDISINQSYPAVGPLHTSNTKTINGFLGTTVLADVREKMVNNRLMYGEYSPFMEIMGIHPKDPAVDVALKFQSVMFGAPYISYFSYTLPDKLRETLNFWIQYWKTNSNYLLNGEFEAYDAVHRYTILKAGDATKQIIAFYARTESFDLGYFNFEMADLINSTDYPYLAIKGKPTGKVDYIIHDHSGRYVNRGSLKFRRDVAVLEVPIGGFARLIVK